MAKVMRTPTGVQPGNNKINPIEKTGRYKDKPDCRTAAPLSPPFKLLDQVRDRIRRLGCAMRAEMCIGLNGTSFSMASGI